MEPLVVMTIAAFVILVLVALFVFTALLTWGANR